MNSKIKNQGTINPNELKAGDIFITTVVCHVRNSIQQPGKLAFKIYEARPPIFEVDGIPQGNPVHSPDDTAFGHALFYPLGALDLHHES